jgi:hypothetical protein
MSVARISGKVLKDLKAFKKNVRKLEKYDKLSTFLWITLKGKVYLMTQKKDHPCYRHAPSAHKNPPRINFFSQDDVQYGWERNLALKLKPSKSSDDLNAILTAYSKGGSKMIKKTFSAFLVCVFLLTHIPCVSATEPSMLVNIEVKKILECLRTYGIGVFGLELPTSKAEVKDLLSVIRANPEKFSLENSPLSSFTSVKDMLVSEGLTKENLQKAYKMVSEQLTPEKVKELVEYFNVDPDVMEELGKYLGLKTCTKEVVVVMIITVLVMSGIVFAVLGVIIMAEEPIGGIALEALASILLVWAGLFIFIFSKDVCKKDAEDIENLSHTY